MMVPNAAFIPDAVPAAAMPQGPATTSAPVQAGGGFQQLLQGYREQGEPAAAQQPAGDAATGSAAGSAPGTAEQGKGPSAEQGASVVVSKLQQSAAWQELHGLAVNSAPVAEQGNLLLVKGGAGKAVPAEEAEAEAIEAFGSDVESGAKAPQAADPAGIAAAMSAAAAGLFAQGPDVKADGRAIAAAAVESNMERRSGTAASGAGEEAYARLTALQGREMQEASAREAMGAQPEGNAPLLSRPEETAVGKPFAGTGVGQEAAMVKEAAPTSGAAAKVDGADKAVAVAGEIPAGVQIPAAGPAVVKAAAAGGEAAGTTVRNPYFPGVAFTKVKGVEEKPSEGGETASADPAAGAAPAMETVAAGDAEGAVAVGAGAAEATRAEVKVKTAQLKQEDGAAAVKGEVAAEKGPVQAAGQDAAHPAEHQEKRGVRGMDALQHQAGKEADPAQQGAAKTSSGEVAGTGNTATAARLASEQGGGGDASGETGKEAHSGQNFQEPQPGQSAATAFGAQLNQATETAHAETKETASKGTLRESILAQVKEGTVTHDGKGNGEMSIKLNPGELGELKIQVRMEDNRLKVEVQADNRMVKDLLMNNLDALKETLSAKNFTMDGFNVSTGGGGFNAPLHEERGDQRKSPQRFARGAGYDGAGESRVKYMTDEPDTLLSVRL